MLKRFISNFFFLGVKAQVQLAVHLDNIAKIINRTMASLDLNPSLNQLLIVFWKQSAIYLVYSLITGNLSIKLLTMVRQFYRLHYID
jgi:hypothetical protein